MRPEEVKALLASFVEGSTDMDEAMRELTRVPVDDIGFARLDLHRELRQGMPEAIYAEGKTPQQVVAIADRLLEHTSSPVFATRVPEATATALLERWPEAEHNVDARVVIMRRERDTDLGSIAVVSAGTSDLPVAEEAACIADALGASVKRVPDVGVAGVHRVLAVQDVLRESDVVIVVAGMEGALPSLIGGLVGGPVIAVPTSVGYGASFGGLAALLAMLNSCAAGVLVTNIDNGFGAAMAALRFLRAK